MRIDAFTHAVPETLKKALARIAPDLSAHTEQVPTLYDMDRRFAVMDHYPEVLQVPTLALTAARILDDPHYAVDFARRANDSMAELVAAHPGRFAAGTASLPTTDPDAAVEELERA